MMESEEFRQRVREASWRLQDLRVMQKQLMASAQQISTIFTAMSATDWEERYLAEGVMELEAAANRVQS